MGSCPPLLDSGRVCSIWVSSKDETNTNKMSPNTINSGVQVQVLLFGDCAFSWYRLCGVLIIMGYFSTRLNIW